ncbi:cytochrome P450 [Nostoc sp. CHAB 5844]|nr:cytochrome P450 [Nostoc sp. CHAB 5844]
MHSTYVLPPGPRPTPWQTLLLATKTFHFFQQCATRYGEPFTTTITDIKTVFTGQPEGIQQIFNANPNLFDTITGSNVGVAVGENSLLVISGTQHNRERKLIMPMFHGTRLRTYGHTIQAITVEHTGRWQPNQVLIVQQTSQAISLEVIIQVVFGSRKPTQVARLRQVIVAFLKAFIPPIIFFPLLRQEFGGFGPWSHFQLVLKTFNDLLEREITIRRTEGFSERDDILSMLLAARDEDGQPMTDEQIRDEIKTMLLAGYETTASALAWACYWIHRAPAIQDKLRAELMPLGSLPDPEALTRLPYLKAVCQETLRMCPPVPFAIRLLKQPWAFCGYELPAGIGIGTAIGVTHFDPKIYPEPQTFRPERFLEQQYSPYEYLPFGGGTRRCLGAAFALYEMQIVLGTIMARHKLALAEQKPVTPSSLGFAISPKGNVKMVILS